MLECYNLIEGAREEQRIGKNLQLTVKPISGLDVFSTAPKQQPLSGVAPVSFQLLHHTHGSKRTFQGFLVKGRSVGLIHDISPPFVSFALVIVVDPEHSDLFTRDLS